MKIYRSSPPRNEQRFPLSNTGNISIRRSVKYTVVPRSRASKSIAVFGRTKCVTSAI